MYLKFVCIYEMKQNKKGRKIKIKKRLGKTGK